MFWIFTLRQNYRHLSCTWRNNDSKRKFLSRKASYQRALNTSLIFRLLTSINAKRMKIRAISKGNKVSQILINISNKEAITKKLDQKWNVYKQNVYMHIEENFGALQLGCENLFLIVDSQILPVYKTWSRWRIKFLN